MGRQPTPGEIQGLFQIKGQVIQTLVQPTRSAVTRPFLPPSKPPSREPTIPVEESRAWSSKDRSWIALQFTIQRCPIYLIR